MWEMANGQGCKRSVSNAKSRKFLLGDLGKGTDTEKAVGESSLQRDFEDLTVSRRLVRSVSHNLRKKGHKGSGEEESNGRNGSLGCLGFYGKGGGCKVGADTCEEFGDWSVRRKSSAGEESKGYQPICGSEDTRVECFSYSAAERFWKRNSKKDKGVKELPPTNQIELLLPDDLLEMCLMRLPMTSLMTARLVCKKWRDLTSTPRFMQIRREGLYQRPWLFLFGVVKDGYCTGQIHAFDASLDRWHRINAETLKGRFMFSVASVGDDIYVVGGCSSLANFGRIDKSSFKTHKGVFVFNPVCKSWRKVAPMKSARSSPVVGVIELSSDCSLFRTQQDRFDRRFSRSRFGAASDVYEDPHRLSLRRQLGDAFSETDASGELNRKPFKLSKQDGSFPSLKGFKRFILIVVGGLGSWDEPLDSGEIYDPVSNKWIDIMRLPGDFGIVCSAAVCNGMFYVYSETEKLAAYNFERCMWIGIQTSHSPPRLHEYYPKLLSCRNKLFVLSVSWCEQDGQSGRREKAVRKLWELDLSRLTWAEISRHPDAPMDWNAAFVADRDRIFGIEMFKIFGQVLDFLTVCDASDSGFGWSHISKKHMAQELDASSCFTKSLAVLHL
ncbi:hypothetical protein Scep_019943 [Stephania cephalantha]|uniref:F-box domain-containing protein n=1 Tax=Stephania cephalantha TaxID=152367 RepID=A0AAP0IBS5_9MAGN